MNRLFPLTVLCLIAGLISGFLISYIIYQPRIENLQKENENLNIQIENIESRFLTLQEENNQLKQKIITLQKENENLKQKLYKPLPTGFDMETLTLILMSEDYERLKAEGLTDQQILEYLVEKYGQSFTEYFIQSNWKWIAGYEWK